MRTFQEVEYMNKAIFAFIFAGIACTVAGVFFAKKLYDLRYAPDLDDLDEDSKQNNPDIDTLDVPPGESEEAAENDKAELSEVEG